MFNCSMKGCTNTSYNSQEDFYTFPKNFNICMLWVQNCGRDELFQEFIYGGAEPFINKWICSGHFRETDFINNTKVLGLKPKVLPIKSCQPITSVVIKQELLELPNEDPLLGVHKNVDVAIAPELHTLTTHNFLRPHHLYYAEETPRFIPPILIPETIVKDCIEPEQVVDIKPPIQQDEKRTMKRKENALRKAYKRLNETDEQRRRRNSMDKSDKTIQRLDQNAKRTALRRACETAEQRQERLEQNAKRTAFRRASENPEQRKERLRKNAERAAQRRAQEMYNETLERRMKNAMRAAERRRNESEQQRLERRMKDKLRARKWRSQETEDQLRERRYKNALTAAMRRNNESEEQAQHRKSMNAQRAAYRRSVDYVNNSNCGGGKLPHHGLGLDTNSCSSSVAETVARVSAGGEQVATINLSGLGATAGGAVLASVLCGAGGGVGMMEQDCRNLYSGELSARLLGPSQLPFS